MSDGWGDAKSCARCGHPSSYHGVSFCQVDAGSYSKRKCDCSGWTATPAWSLDEDRLTDALIAADDSLTLGEARRKALIVAEAYGRSIT